MPHAGHVVDAPAVASGLAPVVTDVLGLRLMTVDGEVVALGLEDRARPFALVFLNDGCTISRRYVPRLNELAREAAELGVTLYGVISNPAISWSDARKFRDEYALQPPLLYDASGELGRQVAPRVVPSAFVVDLQSRITYRGRIDDRFPSLTKVRPRASRHDLLDAMQAVASGPVAHATETEAAGCAYTGWPESEAAPTFVADVAPIVYANCTECHRSGGVGPFPLDSYAAAKRWSTMMSAVTRSGLMPPWRAVHGVGRFQEERFLTERQIATLDAWDRAGAPLGGDEEARPQAALRGPGMGAG